VSKYLTKAERDALYPPDILDVKALHAHADAAEALLLRAAQALLEAQCTFGAMGNEWASRDAQKVAAKIRAAVGAKEEGRDGS